MQSVQNDALIWHWFSQMCFDCLKCLFWCRIISNFTLTKFGGDVCVPYSRWASVLRLQHHPRAAVCGRGLLQPRGYHLCPLAQRLQTPILHQDREQWVMRQHAVSSLCPPTHANVCVFHLCGEYSCWGGLLNHIEFTLAFHWTLA